jgi:hypothetical protein
MALNEMAQAISVSDRKQRTLFSNLHDALVICDASGMVVEYHDGDTGVLGVDERRHAGRRLLEVWPEWRHAAGDWSEIIRGAAEDGRRIRLHDVRLVPPDAGRNGPVVDFVVYRVECGDTPCAAIVVRDVTDRHDLQTKLHQAQTMEAIGTMAGGLAHDVNNLLSGVTSTLSSLEGEFHNSEHGERMQTALRACRRAAGLIRRLLQFAHGVQGNPLVFAPGEILETIVDSMEPSFFANLRVSREIDRDVRVRMDQDHFAQIVLNLLRNACDAMPEGGSLHIRLESAQARHPDQHDEDRTFALLTVTDTGGGIPREVQDRIFEPFFSTKSRTASRGLGMGLAIVYSTVKNTGGFVEADSKTGSGTSIRVYIPAVTSATTEQFSVAESAALGNGSSPS